MHGCPLAIAAPGSRGRRGPCSPTRAPRRCRGVGAGSTPWSPSGEQGSPVAAGQVRSWSVGAGPHGPQVRWRQGAWGHACHPSPRCSRASWRRGPRGCHEEGAHTRQRQPTPCWCRIEPGGAHVGRHRHPVGLGPGFPELPRDGCHRRGWVLSLSLLGVTVPTPGSAAGCCGPCAGSAPLAAGPPGAAVPPERGAGAEPGAGAAPGLPVAAGSAARRAPRHQALQAGHPRPGHQLHRPPQPRTGPWAPPASAFLPAPQTPPPAPCEGETRAPLPQGAAPEHHTPGCPLHGSTQCLGPPLSPVRASRQPLGPQCMMELVPGVPNARWGWSLKSPAYNGARPWCLVYDGAGPWGPHCMTELVPGAPSAPQQPFPWTPAHPMHTSSWSPWSPCPQAWGTSSKRTGTTLPALAPLSLAEMADALPPLHQPLGGTCF